jgi:hypothetical protein
MRGETNKRLHHLVGKRHRKRPGSAFHRRCDFCLRESAACVTTIQLPALVALVTVSGNASLRTPSVPPPPRLAYVTDAAYSALGPTSNVLLSKHVRGSVTIK